MHPIPNHRPDGPLTSRRAGRSVEHSGLAATLRNRCLATVTTCPGLTAREIERLIHVKAHKRLPELRAQGAVTSGDPRPCTVTGRRAMTWRPAEGEQAHG